VNLNFTQAFNTVSRNIILDKLTRNELDKGMVTESWLNSQAPSLVISGKKSSWSPVTTGEHQGSMVGPMLFDAFINVMVNPQKVCQ